MLWNGTIHQPGVDLQDKRTKPRKHRDSQFGQYKDIRKEHQSRLRTGPGKPVYNQSWKKATGPKNSGNPLNPTKNIKCMEGSKMN